MKGMALAWGGVLAICVVATFIVYYMTSADPVYRNIMIEDGQIISFGNDVLLTQKMYDTGIDYIAQKAAYDLGKDGGGYNEWSDTTTLDMLKTKFQEKLNGYLDFTGNGYTIDTDSSTVTLDIANSKFNLKTSSRLSFTDSEHGAHSLIIYNVNKDISSSYFNLIQTGLNIFDPDGVYYPILVSGNDVATIASSLQTKLRTVYPSSTVTTSGNVLTITLIDQNSIDYVSDTTTSKLSLIFTTVVVPSTCTVATDCPTMSCKTAACTDSACVYIDTTTCDSDGCCPPTCSNVGGTGDPDCTATCSDGTPVNTCSSTRPLYCSPSGTLAGSCKCVVCTSGWICNTLFKCVPRPVQ